MKILKIILLTLAITIPLTYLIISMSMNSFSFAIFAMLLSFSFLNRHLNINSFKKSIALTPILGLISYYVSQLGPGCCGGQILLIFLPLIFNFLIAWYLINLISKRIISFVLIILVTSIFIVTILYIGDVTNTLGSDLGILPGLIGQGITILIFSIFYPKKQILNIS